MESAEPDIFGFDLFGDFPEGELHPLQIDAFEDEVDVLNELVNSKVNIYRPLKEGTELHRAIRSGHQPCIDGLLNAYQLGFDKIRDYLTLKYQWDPEDRIWLRKINLVAVGEDQCRSVKDLERNCATVGRVDLERSVFVLLQSPVDGEEVAVLDPECEDHLELFRTMCKLFSNGYLSWNYCEEESGRWETFVETAATRGNNYAIKRLHSLGAQLSIPEHNPLLAACASCKMDTIHYFLDNHFDDFDFTQRHGPQNALIILMQRNDAKSIDYVLEKMIEYRQKHHSETKSEAFNSIFRYEDNECTYNSVLTFIRPCGPLRQKIEQYIIEYELDLSYQWENVTILAELLRKKVALEYCRAGIRKNPDLLGMKWRNESTVLHECIFSGELSLLKDLYVLNPEVRKFFDMEQGFTCFQVALNNHQDESVEFMLEYHKDFFLRDLERLQNIIVSRLNIGKFLEWTEPLFMKIIPECREKIKQAVEFAHKVEVSNDLEREFEEITKSIIANPLDVSKFQHIICSIRGPKGESVLHNAVENDNLPLFKELLQAGCDLDALDNEGNHLIHVVQSVDMLNLLIDCHPDGRSVVNRVNTDGYSVVHKICSRYLDYTMLISLLETVLEYGADVNHRTNNGESAVFMLSSVKLLKVLMNHSVDLFVINNVGETALLHHLYLQHVSVVQILLPFFLEHPSFEQNAHKYLAPLMKTKRYIFEPDYRTLLDANPEATKLMFDAVYKHSKEESSRIFSEACRRSRHFFVHKFLEYGYDLDFNCKDEYGYTPIMGLLNFSKEKPGDLVRLLLEKGVDLEIRNEWNKTALLELVQRFGAARWSGEGLSAVQLLLDYGAQVNDVDDSGNTALHWAFRNRDWELVELLIQYGADLTAKNNDGKVPCEMGTNVSREVFGLIDNDRFRVSLSKLMVK